MHTMPWVRPPSRPASHCQATGGVGGGDDEENPSNERSAHVIDCASPETTETSGDGDDDDNDYDYDADARRTLMVFINVQIYAMNITSREHAGHSGEQAGRPIFA